MRRDEEEYYELGEVLVLATTDKAVRVEFEHDGETQRDWFPWSQVHEDSDVQLGYVQGDRGEFIISGWLARQRGWL